MAESNDSNAASIPLSALPLFSQLPPISVKLTDGNFLIWQQQVDVAVCGYGLESFLTGEASPPPQMIADPAAGSLVINPAFIARQRQDRRVAGWLLSTDLQRIYGEHWRPILILAKSTQFSFIVKVDLKLKICRGSSIKKILVREAKSYYASEVIVGTAVNNGKIVFQHESSLSASHVSVKELKHNHRNGYTFCSAKIIKVLNEGGDPIRPMLTWGEGGCGKPDSVEKEYSICTPDSVTWQKSCR